ncbi:MAG TPA: hypothetical protein VFC46_17885, partial [Humisphaera sp.]|nr:hypothetical protein [Humisphaera sp.]
AYADAYSVTATGGTINVVVGSNDFVPQVEVLDGNMNAVAVDANFWWNNTATVSFHAQPGQQYFVVVAAEDWGWGNYAVAYSGVSFDQQLNPQDYSSGASNAGFGSAATATTPTVAGQIFSQQPINA